MPREIPFDRDRPLVVRRPFRDGGRQLHTGEAFEWKHRPIQPRRVKALYEAGYLRHEGDEPVQKPRRKPKARKPGDELVLTARWPTVQKRAKELDSKGRRPKSKAELAKMPPVKVLGALREEGLIA